MHLDTTPAMAAAVEIDKLMAGVGRSAATTVLILIAITIVASILANWLVSQLIAKQNATFDRAVSTFLAQVVAIIVSAAILYFFLWFLAALKAQSDLVVIGLFGSAALFLMVWISIPMQIYDIGILRSIGFILLSTIVGGVAANIAQDIFVGPIPTGKLPARIEQIVSVASITAKSAPPDSSEADLAKRRAALQQRFEQLEIRRRYLPPNDQKAFADYERDRVAYERDLEQLKAGSAQ
jgi:hypothetical protein